MSEIEKYYNGEIHVDFDDEYEKMNEYELRLILKSADELIKNDGKEIRVLREENERLKEENKKYNKWIESINKDNHRLHSIIKEVREYIEENTNSDSFTELTSGKITDIPYCIVAFEDILEILDKGE